MVSSHDPPRPMPRARRTRRSMPRRFLLFMNHSRHLRTIVEFIVIAACLSWLVSNRSCTSDAETRLRQLHERGVGAPPLPVGQLFDERLSFDAATVCVRRPYETAVGFTLGDPPLPLLT